jgi:hypothetical protein
MGLLKPLEYLSLTVWIILIINFIIKLVLTSSKGSFSKKTWFTAISLIIPNYNFLRSKNTSL